MPKIFTKPYQLIKKWFTTFTRINISIEAKQIMKLLRGKSGLEIGGPSKMFESILPVYFVVKALDDFSFPRPVEWGGRDLESGTTYRYSKYNRCGRQFIGDATDLSVIASKTYDFLLASHVLEHIANPFKALKEWKRVLKDGGYMLFVVPHKEGTFDHNRPVTKLEHLIQDCQSNIGENDEAHFDEILELTDYSRNKKIHTFDLMKKWMKANTDVRGMHQHVFDTEIVLRMCDYADLKILVVYHLSPFNITVLCQKVMETDTLNNKSFLSVMAPWRQKSPFLSDKKTCIKKTKLEQ